MATTTPIDDAQIMKALDAPFTCYDFDEPITLRKWYATVLAMLIDEDEGFSGKRPFGNSGWKTYLGRAFVAAGIAEGDEDGYPIDRDAIDPLLIRAISLMSGVTSFLA